MAMMIYEFLMKCHVYENPMKLCAPCHGLVSV